MPSISDNLGTLHERIGRACAASGRDAGTVTLVCVSKTKPREQILEAYAAGERHFGESYATEAAAKIESLKDSGLDGVVWHFIGPIQKNKTKIIASYFDVVESVDRQIIAQRLDAQRPPHLPPLDILLQVNISGEAQKSGCSPEALPALVDYVKTCPRLRLRGLMGIAREGAPEEEILTSFTRLRQLFERLHEECGTDILSMGMSGDLESAVKAGATEVRIGTDIFGAREKKQPAETAALAELAQKDKAPRLTLTQGFIGGGNMARAIFAGLLPLSRAALFTVSTPHPEKLSFFREAGAGITSDNRTAAAAQVLWLAVKPQQLPAVLAELAEAGIDFSERLVISMAAGFPLSRLCEALKSERVARIMPNTPARLGLGVTALCCGAGVSPADRKLLAELLAPLGLCVPGDEAQLNLVGALAGCGPAYVFRYLEALVSGLSSRGMDVHLARRIAEQTVRGAVALADRSPEHTLAELREAVTSKGGTTAAGLAEFDRFNFEALMEAVLEASLRRTKELERGSL